MGCCISSESVLVTPSETDTGTNAPFETFVRVLAPPPASKRAIRQLPIVKVTPEDLVDENNRECCICLEPWVNNYYSSFIVFHIVSNYFNSSLSPIFKLVGPESLELIVAFMITIPSSIKLLTYLTHLDLQIINLAGTTYMIKLWDFHVHIYSIVNVFLSGLRKVALVQYVGMSFRQTIPVMKRDDLKEWNTESPVMHNTSWNEWE